MFSKMTDGSPNLPQAPNDLCFPVADFLQKDFQVDTFLQDHRKAVKLETMRDDLGVYLKLLRSAMIDLINRDYADFVNLSSNIIDLDKAINDLETPLGQLKEEVMTVRQALDDEIKEIEEKLDFSNGIASRKMCLYSLTRVHKSLKKLSTILRMDCQPFSNIDTLEQAATELSQLKFHQAKCKSNISMAQEEEITLFHQTTMNSLNELFISCVNKNDTNLLIRCLRIYTTLDQITEAENLVKQSIVGPSIDRVLEEEIGGSRQTDLSNLRNIYQKFLGVSKSQLQQLLDVTCSPNRTAVKGFNFLVNSFWTEIAKKMDENLKFIFAPGNPDLFHRRYIETLEFLNKLEKECDQPEILLALKTHPGYKNFLKKWNLPVYYQIRFQETASKVEEVLTNPVSSANYIKGTKNDILSENFTLGATIVVWECIIEIWSEQIFLQQLFPQFWKLSLQLFSRFRIWVQSVLKEVWLDDINSENSKVDFLIHLHMDVDKLIKRIPYFFNVVESRYKCNDEAIKTPLKVCLEETTKELENIIPSVTEETVKEILKPCLTHLKQVSDIPRLFRRTNREVPNKCCAYVKNTFQCVENFHSNYNNIIPNYLHSLLELALSSLTEHYREVVTLVLTSVQKTEESLKRLKAIRDKSIGNSPLEPSGVNDDEKIRIQLQVDVREYTNMIKELGISLDGVRNLKELIEIVEAAIKK